MSDQPKGEFDPRTEANIDSLLPEVRPLFRQMMRHALIAASNHGCVVRIISGTRTYEEQDALYAQGRSKPGRIVTKARGGQSNHNFGIAVDLGIFANGEYLDSANPSKAERVHKAIAEAIHKLNLPLEWGGDWKTFKDTPHWQYRTGLSIRQLADRKAHEKPYV